MAPSERACRPALALVLLYAGGDRTVCGITAMTDKMRVIKSVDKQGREVFTYVKAPAQQELKQGKRKKRNEAIRITLKLPK
jgi:hypothetical protein